MVDQINLTFKMPPSTNDLWGYSKGRVYLKEGARKYHSHVQSMLDSFEVHPRINVPVEVEIITHFSDQRKHDIDNIVKILFDSLTMAEFWEDDELVSKFSVERGAIRPMAVIEVNVTLYSSCLKP